MRTTLFAALLVAAPLSAQQLPSGFKAQQIADFERERRMTLAMVDTMPERLLHFKPVQEVRDFAQQIAHAAVPVAIFAASAKGEKPPALGDSTVYLNSKQALRETVNKSYDYALGVVNGLSDADYAGTTTFAKYTMTRWRILELAHEHSVWTRGELVSYFRLNGRRRRPSICSGLGAGSR